jgi:hypothetical protein
MKKPINLIPIFAAVILLAGLFLPAFADVNLFKELNLPETNPPEWKTGQSATYKMSVNGIEDFEGSLKMDIRMAIVGEEKISGQNYYWYEVDLSNISGIPSEASFVKSIRLKMLTRYHQSKDFNDNPKQLLQEFADGNLIKKLIFQLNDDTPRSIDYSTFSEMFSSFTGEKNLQSVVNTIPWEEMDASSIPPDFKIDTGKKDVTVKAGTFKSAAYVSFGYEEKSESVKGIVHAHDSVPISGLLKLSFDVKDAGENIQVTLDLTDYKMTGAKSMITGTPIPFEMTDIMGMASMGEPSK